MKRSKIARVFEQIAAQEGISVEEVRSEIQKAIEIGFTHPDPAVQQYWQSIPYRGDKPTPEEVVLQLSKMARIRKCG